MSQYSLVGAYHRPPAKAIIEALPSGAQLTVRPEPDNQFDPNALQVLVQPSEIPEGEYEELGQKVEGYGFDLDHVLAASEWHLGYIPRVDAEVLAPQFGGHARPARLGFDGKGKPLVVLDD